MKLLRLHVQSFAAIGNVDIEFGPGLNVLYGPNDLGKSTVAESIRFALLLPHASTHSEAYVSWTGGGDPTVELTFATSDQRIWRVRKQFGKPGSSLLQESKNGHDFDDVERSRGVDGKLREILRWGIPEPGGASAPKGMPSSFLATALLSTQTDVSAILGDSLQTDKAGSGKEQIAQALQAVAQDPLFVEIFRKTQEPYNSAYTEKGRKKTGAGSPFKDAADRVNQTRIEKDRLQEIVEDSESAEHQLRDLSNRKLAQQEQLQAATAHLASLELLARQATERSAAEERVRQAEAEVIRIADLRSQVQAVEEEVAQVTRRVAEARAAAEAARTRKKEAESGLATAQELARAEESDPSFIDKLKLRNTLAERALQQAEQQIATVLAAKNTVDAASAAANELKLQQSLTKAAGTALAEAESKEKNVEQELHRCTLLDRAMELHAAERQVDAARAGVDNKQACDARMEAATRERALLAKQRAALVVPTASQLSAMRKLETELAKARGALEVGLVATVIPVRALDLTVQSDGTEASSLSITQPQEFEADAELEIAVEGVATFRVRGGRREAQARASALADRWQQEAVVHLAAAGAGDVEGLSVKVAEAQQLEAGIHQKDSELKSLQEQIAPLLNTAETLRHAAAQAEACRARLGDVDLQPLLAELSALGDGAGVKLEKRRQQWAIQVAAARVVVQKAANAHGVAEERVRQSRSLLEAAIASRDIALKPFSQKLDAALLAAQKEQITCMGELQAAEKARRSLDESIAARKQRSDAAQRNARANVEKAVAAVNSAEKHQEEVVTRQASLQGRLIELRRARDAADPNVAADKLRAMKEQWNALPVPAQIVTPDELENARASAEALRAVVNTIERDMHRAHGALEQVGGAVARDRLFDATEAFEAAERHEREIEADYEAWKLLLEQMKEAEAAQASNLGLALVPAIAGGFNKLTQQRYQSVKLEPHLGTEGVVVAGAVRPVEYLSVGTREQLSTLFRLSLAEYLRTAIVLDDQLVQSDDVRMGWFRELLVEKAPLFQIIVLTCRPSDYLPPTAVVPAGSGAYTDIVGLPVRAVDLGRALRRR